MNKKKVFDSIIDQGFLPLFFHPDENTCIEVLGVLYGSGIRVIEYTNRGRQALKIFETLCKVRKKQFPDLNLGLGTVLDAKTGLKAVNNGADFLVSPGYSKELLRFSTNKNILWIPGCMSPTELIQAQNDDLTLIKLFPASSLGPMFLKSAREVFPNLLFMPTGGIDLNDFKTWFEAGASAVGMGSSLISRKSMDAKEFEPLRSKLRSVIDQIAAIRASGTKL